jgi:hypothetical protein
VTTAAGQALAPGGWTNQSQLHLEATLASPAAGAVLVPEVEFRPADVPFTDRPNVLGTPTAGTSCGVLAPAMMAGQQYHWQIRAREVGLGGKAGPWVAFGEALGYAPEPPPAPRVAPLPDDGVVTQSPVRLAWTAPAGAAGLAGFAYAVDQQPDGTPPPWPTSTDPADTAATVELAADGDWYFHVRSLDRAGNWSPTATLALHLDTVPLTVEDPFYRTFATHPDFGPLPIAFRVSKPAIVTVSLLPARADTPVRTYALGLQQDRVSLQWDLRDEQGALVPPGRYRFRILAADRAGNTVDVTYDRLLVTRKRIVVSLGQQRLWAYDGSTLVLGSLVTTGGPLLPTPTGTFQILGKFAPFTFQSPWPKGSPYWYPDSPTSYAMLFDEGGYFIHDAPWRHTFGPGSNLVPGQPGEETSGTHGCVNVPLDVQAQLFAWTDPGTPVIVQQ